MKSALFAAAGTLALCACANMENDSYSADDTQAASSETETAMSSEGAWSEDSPDASEEAPAAASGTGAAVGAAASPLASTPTPQEFAGEAIQLSMLTVDASELAAQNATDPEVKAFAAQALTDHQAIIDRIKAAYPEAAAAELDVARSAEIAELSAATGAGFDDEYLDLVDDSHEQAIALYGAVAGDTGMESGSTGETPMAEGDAEIEEATLIAEETLPKLQAHFTEIQQLDAKIGDSDDMMEMETDDID